MAHAPVGSPRGRGAKTADFGAKMSVFDPIFGGPDPDRRHPAAARCLQTSVAGDIKRGPRTPAGGSGDDQRGPRIPAKLQREPHRLPVGLGRELGGSNRSPPPADPAGRFKAQRRRRTGASLKHK